MQRTIDKLNTNELKSILIDLIDDLDRAELNKLWLFIHKREFMIDRRTITIKHKKVLVSYLKEIEPIVKEYDNVTFPKKFKEVLKHDPKEVKK